MTTTSLKLPDDLRARAAEAARNRGITTHAFMLSAIREAITAAERRAEFVAAAQAALDETLQNGEGFDAQDVHDYLRAKVSVKTAVPPQAKSWRD